MSSFGLGGLTEKLTYWLLALAVFLAPIFFIPSSAFPFEGTKIAILLFGTLLSLCFLAVTSIERQEITLPRQLLLFSVWFLPIVYLVSALWNNTLTPPFGGSGLEIDSLYFIIICALAFTIASFTAGEKSRLKLFGFAWLASFGILSLFQLSRLFFGSDFLSFGGLLTGSASNLLGKWNEIGVFYGMSAAISLVWFAARTSPAEKFLSALVLVISLFFAAVVNLSVVWWLVGLVSLAVAVGGFLGKKSESGKSRSAAFLALVVLLVSFYFILPSSWVMKGDASNDSRNYLANSFGVQYLEARPSWEGTMAVAKHVYGDRALLGSGPGTFVSEWLKSKPSDINRTVFWNTDFLSGVGFVPTSIVTTGILGLLAWIVFFLAVLFTGMQAFLGRFGGTLSTYSVMTFTAAVFLLAASVFYSLGPVLLLAGFLCAGLFFASLRSDGVAGSASIRFEDNPRFGFVATLASIVLFLGAAASMFFFGTNFVGAIELQKGTIAFAQDGDLDKALEHAALAATFGANDKAARLSAAAELAYVQKVLNDASLTAEEARTQFEQHFNAGLAHATKATELNPRDYQNWVSLGRISEVIAPLGNEAANEKAAKAYDRAIEMNPQSPVLYLLRANLDVARGAQAEARAFLEKAIEKKPDYTEAIFTLSQLQIAANNVPEAIKSVEQAAALEPQNPVVFFQLGLLYYSQNRFQDAGAAFFRATDLNKDYANAHYFLGLTYDRLGSRADAIKEFEQVLRTNPGSEEVTKIVENLKANRGPFAEFDPPKTGDIRKLDGLPIQENSKVPQQ